MRKRNVLDISDIIMWQLIGLFPLILCLLSSINNLVNFNEFVAIFFDSMNFNSNAIYRVLYGIFSSNYDLLILDNILKCVSFYVTIQLVHIVVDVLLFVPNVISKLFGRICK